MPYVIPALLLLRQYCVVGPALYTCSTHQLQLLTLLGGKLATNEFSCWVSVKTHTRRQLSIPYMWDMLIVWMWGDMPRLCLHRYPPPPPPPPSYTVQQAWATS